jgi:hypothetical protein
MTEAASGGTLIVPAGLNYRKCWVAAAFVDDVVTPDQLEVAALTMTAGRPTVARKRLTCAKLLSYQSLASGQVQCLFDWTRSMRFAGQLPIRRKPVSSLATYMATTMAVAVTQIRSIVETLL